MWEKLPVLIFDFVKTNFCNSDCIPLHSLKNVIFGTHFFVNTLLGQSTYYEYVKQFSNYLNHNLIMKKHIFKKSRKTVEHFGKCWKIIGKLSHFHFLSSNYFLFLVFLLVLTLTLTLTKLLILIEAILIDQKSGKNVEIPQVSNYQKHFQGKTSGKNSWKSMRNSV